jgi:hypothetical protein
MKTQTWKDDRSIKGEKPGMRVSVPKLDREQPSFHIAASAQAVRMAQSYGLPLASAALCQRLLNAFNRITALEAKIEALEKR